MTVYDLLRMLVSYCQCREVEKNDAMALIAALEQISEFGSAVGFMREEPHECCFISPGYGLKARCIYCGEDQ